nr:uncharacterized protein LOC112426265 [Macaca nemestrina]
MGFRRWGWPDTPKAEFPPSRGSRRPGASSGSITLPPPSSSASDVVPPAHEQGTWNSLSRQSPAGSATRRPPLTPSGWEEEAAGGDGPLDLLKNIKRQDGVEISPGESSRVHRVAAGRSTRNARRRNATRLGHTFNPRGCLERLRVGDFPGFPHHACNPLPRPPGHCHSRREASGSQTLGPAAARATFTRRRHHEAWPQRTPCSLLRPRVSRRVGRD